MLFTNYNVHKISMLIILLIFGYVHSKYVSYIDIV